MGSVKTGPCAGFGALTQAGFTTIDDAQGDADRRQERPTASVGASGNPAPVLRTSEQVLDPVPLLVEHGIVRARLLPSATCRGTGGDTLVVKGLTEPDGVVAPVGRGSRLTGDRAISKANAPFVSLIRPGYRKNVSGQPSPAQTL